MRTAIKAHGLGVVMALVLTLFLWVDATWAASAGPFSCGDNGATCSLTNVVGDSGSSLTWANPTNAQVSDNVYAAKTLTGAICQLDRNPFRKFVTELFTIPVAEAVGSNVTEYLQAYGFGFSVPSGATIDGILAEIEKLDSAGGGAGLDFGVRLVVNGTIDGATNDRSDTAAWPSVDGYVSHGGATDLWGHTDLTSTNVSAANFGVAIAAQRDCGVSDTVGLRIDHIRITVYYTPAAATPPTETPVSGTRSPSGGAAYGAPSSY